MERGTLLVRLNRFISMCGITSRRKADELIKAGRVKVNGLIVKEMGYRIDPSKDVVEVDGKLLKSPKYRYVILNKPCCYLTSLAEGKDGKKSIKELIKDIPERLYPAGRLDYNAEGLLILTNDGELANRIMHPKYKLPKKYLVLVEGRVDTETLKNMKKGAELEDGFAKPDSIKLIKMEKNQTTLEVVFHEGRKHIVKRFMAHFGHKVKRLKRTAIGPIQLGKLPPGKWRDMTQQELKALKKALNLITC
ncbi:pseudouridine synthase [Hydrogenobacter hydrogenophilus]|uniref:Pseudouridine synthase n=1 Tax=Hydrogenobacter hydrogenophilus TaxID=35835 RepID=A0A285NVY4_9AQUI|nr:pseudouridine synthase [Hydrogenobacter hydrogenophilus]SNZ13599.1 23S rRNA pseudouridine2605 synthase [Hydrogenobacter hydrogenophilus]